MDDNANPTTETKYIKMILQRICDEESFSFQDDDKLSQVKPFDIEMHELYENQFRKLTDNTQMVPKVFELNMFREKLVSDDALQQMLNKQVEYLRNCYVRNVSMPISIFPNAMPVTSIRLNHEPLFDN